jgi:hypothetical protein
VLCLDGSRLVQGLMHAIMCYGGMVETTALVVLLTLALKAYTSLEQPSRLCFRRGSILGGGVGLDGFGKILVIDMCYPGSMCLYC